MVAWEGIKLCGDQLITTNDGLTLNALMVHKSVGTFSQFLVYISLRGNCRNVWLETLPLTTHVLVHFVIVVLYS